MLGYVREEFNEEERDVLRPYFTDLDGPVFALVNLPEVVKGALFARYSRSAKSLRRLFLDEFADDIVSGGDAVPGVGRERAEQLYDRVFFDYGDDSVAQLGTVHLACEQASNVLTKVLEWGRLMSYLEQSTRYVPYDGRLAGRYRYWRDPELLAGPLGARFVGDMDQMFDVYASLLADMTEFFRDAYPRAAGDSDFVYRQAIRAKALDAVRGVLPAGTTSNVGMCGSGQAYEGLLLRMRSLPLPEAQAYSVLMLQELRKVIPAFLRRVDLEDRGVEWSTYLRETREHTAEVAHELFAGASATPAPSRVELVDFDPEGEDKMIAAMLYSSSRVPEQQLLDRVRTMSVDDKTAVVRAYVGDRRNRRHKPGRALERTSYRFDIVSDYGAFRDLQRHRMLTIEWQELGPHLGYDCPEAIFAAGLNGRYEHAMEVSSALHEVLQPAYPAQAAYAVALAYRIRYSLQMNAREAMHLIELRSAPQGHASYRSVAQDMHLLIAEAAGHRAVAAMMRFVDHSSGAELERLEAARRAESRRGDVT